MFVVAVFLEAEPDHVAALRAALIMHARNCLAKEPGCQRFDVSEDRIDSGSFLLYEIYDDEAAHRAHKEYPHYADYRMLVDPWTRSRRVLTYGLVSDAGTA